MTEKELPMFLKDPNYSKVEIFPYKDSKLRSGGYYIRCFIRSKQRSTFCLIGEISNVISNNETVSQNIKEKLSGYRSKLRHIGSLYIEEYKELNSLIKKESLPFSLPKEILIYLD